MQSSNRKLPFLSELLLLLPLLATMTSCRRSDFPDVSPGYREYAYISNGAENTVSVLDLVYMRTDRTLQVGTQPTGMAENPQRNEVYVVNAQPGQNGSLSIIDSEHNRIAGTIPLHKLPYAVAVDKTGHRAYVANSGSNNVSVLDLDTRTEIATAATGDLPGLARISPDGRTLVVSNRGSGSVSIFSLGAPSRPGSPSTEMAISPRATFDGCLAATDIAILPDSSKAFIACSGGHQVLAIGLAASPGSWQLRNDPAATVDYMLTLLDVGLAPVHLAMKPDGGEIFVSNFGSDTISEIATQTDEVGGTYSIGNKPVRGLVSADGSALWVSAFGADSISLYSIDDGRLISSIRAGSAPDALAFAADQHLLLAANAHSGDVALIRTQSKLGPSLFTMMPAGRDPNAIVVKAFTVPK